MHKNSTFSLFILLMLPIAAGAQESKLTLEQAWQLLQNNNISLQQMQATIQQAEQETEIAQADVLPSVAATASYNYVSKLAKYELPVSLPAVQGLTIEAGAKNQYDAALVVQQPVFTGFRLSNQVKAAQAGKEAQSQQQVVLKNQLQLQVGMLYYAIQSNKLAQQTLQQSIQRLQFQRDKVLSFFKVERVTEFDTLEVANQILRLQSQLHSSQNTHRVLLTRLAHLLSLDQRRDIADFQPGKLDLELETLDDYTQAALTHRPEMNQVNALQRSQSFRASMAKSALYPQVYATASYHYARPGVNFFKNQWMDYYTVGAQLQWKLWDWKQRSRKIEQARLELNKTDLQEQQIQQNIEQQVTEAFEQLQSIKQQIELQRNLVLQERRRYQIAKEKFSQGQLSALDLNSIEKELTTAEMTLNQQYIQWQQYRLQLDFATGRL